MPDFPFVPYAHPDPCTDEERLARARQFRSMLDGRRTVRDYDPRDVSDEVLLECIRAAGTAPSGAHRQPWHFVLVRDPDIKRQVREAAEREEQAFYGNRAPEDWLEALAPLGTDAHKPFLETAPALIVVFAERYGENEDGSRRKNYYVQESVGIATGMLISALHACGLSTLTHTPSPMGFLQEVLGRPSREHAFLILVVGHAAADARVPDISRKAVGEIATVL
ncbi:MAG: nitroreductase family protein [Rhodothermales bacterium]|nr:nitroreductase family protein [Rhodothermales bacterium]MBO6781605.1 nitroreductase family protein [Rhodothermales bacterium]